MKELKNKTKALVIMIFLTLAMATNTYADVAVIPTPVGGRGMIFAMGIIIAVCAVAFVILRKNRKK